MNHRIFILAFFVNFIFITFFFDYWISDSACNCYYIMCSCEFYYENMRSMLQNEIIFDAGTLLIQTLCYNIERKGMNYSTIQAEKGLKL